LIETERLLLRKPRLDDADALLEAYSDPETMRYIGDGSTTDLDGVRVAIAKWLARWDADGLGQFAVERRDDGRVVGRVGFLVWDRERWQPGTRAEFGARAEVELGWTLVRAHWGHGYATEAALACRDWALDELGLQRLVSLIMHGNERSVRVAEKLGERYERDITTSHGTPTRLFALERPVGTTTTRRARRRRGSRASPSSPRGSAPAEPRVASSRA
jgi:RimJ/RimL family protein N-acetyltransferase